MAKMMSGTGRLTVFPLLHMWPDDFGVVAYTTTGRFGDTAVLGYVPVPEVPDVRLMDVAARLSPQPTEWAMCTGWSARVVPKPGTVEFHDTPWSMEVDGTSEPAKPVYGLQKLHVGRMHLDVSDLLTRVREVLRSRVGASPA